MKTILLPILGALALAACAVEPQYDLDRQVSGECASGDANIALLQGEEVKISEEIYKNTPAIPVDSGVASLLGGDYVDIAEDSGSAPAFDYHRHIELRTADYQAACIGARAPNP